MAEQYGDLQIDFLGVKGEYVVSQVYGVPFDESGYGALGDDGVDIRTPTPGAIKTNHRRDGYLIVERWRDVHRVDVIHLVDGLCSPPDRCICRTLPARESEVWRYVGYITVDDFKVKSELTNWGIGPRRFVRQRHLSPLNHLRRV